MSQTIRKDALVKAGHPASGEDQEQMRAMSMLAGAAGPQDVPQAVDLDLSSLQESRGVGRGVMLLLLVLGVAAGSIYLMRTGHGDIKAGPEARKVEARVEQALAKLSRKDALAPNDPLRPDNLKALFSNSTKLLQQLASDPTEHQVPITHVQKNPFYLVGEKKAEPEVKKPTGPDPRVVRLDTRLKEVRKEFESLAVQTVVGGARPMAIINGELLAPGQVVGAFTITRIADLRVELDYPKDVRELADELKRSLEPLALVLETTPESGRPAPAPRRSGR